MPRRPEGNVFYRLYGRMMDYLVGLITKPLKRYTLLVPNDMAALKRHIRKGDVVLVEGNERVSECIKYLTQSSWSHSALYVGDEPLRRNPERRAELIEKFGEDANSLMVEALVESGVALSPISKYRNFNIRICRPFNLSSADLVEVMDEALRSVGDTYDIRNIIDLLRYFLPVTLVPARWRRQALEFGSGKPTEVMCSSLIAAAFHRVRFPIVPSYSPISTDSMPPAKRRLWPLNSRSTGALQLGALKMISPTLITPRDFDLSPYFEIVKFNIIESMRFDYRKIVWADDTPAVQIKKGA
ncbi:MAG TPA: YiiX/YebB-like N1pC/P60 family cysteine hydrolase [Candidatus Binataceae bacterium]|nr:YiiX/YebB-like N1pC/P60 family cysteine hydrolase [Candidatus Binataceae bacterium]